MSLLKKYQNWCIITSHTAFPNFCSFSLNKTQCDNFLTYSAATHFTKGISQQTSACQNPTALDISKLQHVGSSQHEHHPA